MDGSDKAAAYEEDARKRQSEQERERRALLKAPPLAVLRLPGLKEVFGIPDL